MIGTPTLAFLVARLGASTAPETRHLIFALPFFAMLVAGGARLARAQRPRRAPSAAAAVAAALLVVGGVAWAWQKTPLLFRGDPSERATARQAAAAAWLADDGRAERHPPRLRARVPRRLGADEAFSHFVLPRADAKLAARELDAPRPLGRGIWVFDAATRRTRTRSRRSSGASREPEAFEARTFGPYLVVRTREPVVTPSAGSSSPRRRRWPG